ncbi:hypothetical protein D3C73_975850 [compost metagenome]
MRKVARQATGRGRQAPERHADRDDLRARIAVGQQGDGDAHDGVEQRKRQAVQQAELRVGQLQIVLDRFDHQRQDLPVDEGKYVR